MSLRNFFHTYSLVPFDDRDISFPKSDIVRLWTCAVAGIPSSRMPPRAWSDAIQHADLLTIARVFRNLVLCFMPENGAALLIRQEKQGPLDPYGLLVRLVPEYDSNDNVVCIRIRPCCDANFERKRDGNHRIRLQEERSREHVPPRDLERIATFLCTIQHMYASSVTGSFRNDHLVNAPFCFNTFIDMSIEMAETWDKTIQISPIVIANRGLGLFTENHRSSMKYLLSTRIETHSEVVVFPCTTSNCAFQFTAEKHMTSICSKYEWCMLSAYVLGKIPGEETSRTKDLTFNYTISREQMKAYIKHISGDSNLVQAIIDSHSFAFEHIRPLFEGEWMGRDREDATVVDIIQNTFHLMKTGLRYSNEREIKSHLDRVKKVEHQNHDVIIGYIKCDNPSFSCGRRYVGLQRLQREAPYRSSWNLSTNSLRVANAEMPPRDNASSLDLESLTRKSRGDSIEEGGYEVGNGVFRPRCLLVRCPGACYPLCKALNRLCFGRCILRYLCCCCIVLENGPVSEEDAFERPVVTSEEDVHGEQVLSQDGLRNIEPVFVVDDE